MSAALQQQRPFTEHDARTYRKNYEQTSHVINRIFNRLCAGRDDKTARAVAKAGAITKNLHGVINGQKLPFFRAHKFAAKQFHYIGDDINAGKFMARRIAELKTAEKIVGRKFFEISPGGTDEQLITGYEADYIGDAAEWALLQVKTSPEYAKHPAKAVTDAILDAAIDRLPPVKIDPTAEFEPEKTEGPSLSDAWIIKGEWTKIKDRIEKNLIRELESGADPTIAANVHIEWIKRQAIHLKTNYTREKLTALSSLGEAYDDDAGGYGNNTQDTFTPLEPEMPPVNDFPEGPADEDTPPAIVRGSLSQPIELAQVTDSPFSELPENATLEQESDFLRGAAQEFRAAFDFSIVPLHSVTDNICSCRDGSECKSPGKHPREAWKFKDENGNKIQREPATADEINTWWHRDRWPLANVGGLTGGASRILVLDVDPRNGGDANLCSLIERYGTEWLHTLHLKTGGGGDHFAFRMPEGFDTTCNNIAPGLDVKWDGLIVLPPSLHASGKRYRIGELQKIADAPQWFIEEVSRARDQKPCVVIDFQEKRATRAGESFFAYGERNNGLRDVACGRWLHGYANDVQDLYQQMIEVRDRRCESIPGDPPPTDTEIWDLVQRTSRKFTRGQLSNGGAA